VSFPDQRQGAPTIDEYLSTGFADVDHADDSDAYCSCLALIDSLPYFKDCKRAGYDLLRLGPGMTVLDAGCGLGDDAFRIANLVMPGGMVAALDSSAVMIGKARLSDLAARLPVEFQAADVRALPFADGSFSRCRIDRVLQHVPRPEEAVSELARVLEPGGLLLAYDNDWGTFTVASQDRATTRALETFWCDSFTNGWIGRDLGELLLCCGLTGVEIYPSTCIIRDFDTADRVYNLRETVRRAAEKGIISPDRGRLWLEELLDRWVSGSFLAAHTAYTVVAGKTAEGQ